MLAEVLSARRALPRVRAFHAVSVLLIGIGACGSGAGPRGFDRGVPPPGEPLATVRTEAGAWDVSLWTSPQPAPKGMVEVMYRIVDPAGVPNDLLTVRVVPWMPAHGHGTSATPTVTAEGDGYYLVRPVVLYMSGRWELRTTIDGIASDSVVPVVDVP
jgi:hypothetical protein